MKQKDPKKQYRKDIMQIFDWEFPEVEDRMDEIEFKWLIDDLVEYVEKKANEARPK